MLRSSFSYPAPGPPVSPTATPLHGNLEIKHFKTDFYQQKHLDEYGRDDREHGTARAVLAVTVLLPGDCDKNPNLCAGP